MSAKKNDRMMRAIEEMEEELAQPLRQFRSAMTSLAEREMPRSERLARRPETASGWRMAWLYAWAPVALLLLLTIGFAVMANEPAQQPAAHATASVTQNASAPASQQVSDNALLTEVDEDLTQNAPTPLAPLEVSTNSKTHTNSTQAEDTYGVEP